MSEFDYINSQNGEPVQDNTDKNEENSAPAEGAEDAAFSEAGAPDGVQSIPETVMITPSETPEQSAEESDSSDGREYEAKHEADNEVRPAPAEGSPADIRPAADQGFAASTQQYSTSRTYSAQVPPPQMGSAPGMQINPQSTEAPPSYVYNGGQPYTRQVPPAYDQYQQGGYQSQNSQPYSQQTSRGYYQPETNEYIYSPPAQKKKKHVGKAIAITLACILSVFVISVASISAYNFFSIYSGNTLRNPFAAQDGGPLGDREDRIPDNYKNEEDDEQVGVPSDSDDSAEDGEDEEAAPVTTPTVIRDFPSIEQLAAPDDAMSIPDIYDKVSPSVVGVSCSVRGGTQTGTGFIISEDGYIVTNAHVIEDYLSVMIVDSDLNEYEAEVIGYDSMTDIAVLKANPEGRDMKPVEFGKSSELRIGELAIAIGNPLGFDLYATLTTGVISGLDRTVTIEDNTMNLLQTSATINRGNSGGPLIDAYGRVIGITSAKVDTQYGESLGFAIPIDEAIPIIESLIKYGYIPGRPSLGITCQNIDDLMSFYYNIPKGVYVFTVTEGSGADKAGIVAGDLIIAIQGESISTSDELTDIKNQYKVGDTVTLTVYRGGSNFDVDVVLGETTPTMGEHAGNN